MFFKQLHACFKCILMALPSLFFLPSIPIDTSHRQTLPVLFLVWVLVLFCDPFNLTWAIHGSLNRSVDAQLNAMILLTFSSKQLSGGRGSESFLHPCLTWADDPFLWRYRTSIHSCYESGNGCVLPRYYSIALGLIWQLLHSSCPLFCLERLS